MNNVLRQARYNRTRALTIVRGTIDHLLTAEAPTVYPNGLPSWWPFWSDVLKQHVRELYRAAYELRNAEHRSAGHP